MTETKKFVRIWNGIVRYQNDIEIWGLKKYLFSMEEYRLMFKQNLELILVIWQKW